MIEILSAVEKYYLEKHKVDSRTARIPYITVDQFPELGLLTALRFLEWVSENPEGVVSLPTGKTPEYFIKWTKYLLDNWENPANRQLMKDSGLALVRKPGLKNLRFVQIDDFYPICPEHHNSFLYFVRKFYLHDLGFDSTKALLINSQEIPLANGLSYLEVFPDFRIDLSLRHREAISQAEEIRQRSIFMIDNWCMDYERKIREMGGIGFFLGGIGPDGHIAFNTRGSNHHSATRLCNTNYETQAAAAGDLGGIEISANRLVITIGLGTLCFNQDAVAVIFAAGEAKARVIQNAIELPPDVKYPATVLQGLKNARFYLTQGAAKLLYDEQLRYFTSGDWNIDKSIRALLDYCQKENVYPHKIAEDSLSEILGFQGESKNQSTSLNIKDTVNEVKNRLSKGLEKVTGKTILHTGPHHDDIMLGILPVVNRQLRDQTNKIHFAILTSGFTAISNQFLIDNLEYCLRLIEAGEIQMIGYPDFFEKGYLFKWDKDVNHYLNKVAERDEEGKKRGLCHRITRCLARIYKMQSIENLKIRIKKIIQTLEGYYQGEKNAPDIQQLKGMIREFEEELVWAHSGKQVKDVHHLRLGFYKGDIFTEQPEKVRDVEPVLNLFRRIEPDIISVTMDPEGSGPDTHYKVLQTIAEALQLWSKEKDLSGLVIQAYRNVWYRYHPSEANVYAPVSLNGMAVLQNSFRQCYLSQLDASFPSPDLHGPFCDLAQKIWVEQFKEVQLLLGKDFFYQNEIPLLRATHGLVFYREIGIMEFLKEARMLEMAMG